MGASLKDKVKPSMKTTKKKRGQKPSIPDNTVSDNCDNTNENAKHQALPENHRPDKVSTEMNGKIEVKEEEKRRVKKSTSSDKLNRKSAKVKAGSNISTQREDTEGEKKPSRLPSSTLDQSSAQNALDTVNESEKHNHQGSYEAESPKANRKKSPMNGTERKRKNGSKSKSPSRELNPSNRMTENTLHADAGSNSPQPIRNNSPRRKQQRMNQNESPVRHRSPSPMNFDSGENDSHPKSKTDGKVSRKRSLSSSAAKKHRKISRSCKAPSSKNDSQEFQYKDKGSSVDTRGDSPKSSHNKAAEQGTSEKKPSPETSTMPDRNPLRSATATNIPHQNDSLQGAAESKTVRGKSPKLRLKTTKLRKDSNKTNKRRKSEGRSKSHQGSKSSGKKVLSGKNNSKTRTKAKSKDKKPKHSKKMGKKSPRSAARKKP